MKHSLQLSKMLRLVISMLLLVVCLQSCYTYRVGTKAQGGAEVQKATAHSYLWGLLQSPKNGVKTPVCDSLNVNGLSTVTVKTNLGYTLITIATLGIWAPIRLEYNCGKPCQVVGRM